MNPKAYSKIVGVVLLLVGIVGFLVPDLLGMDLGTGHSVVHLVTGAVLAWLGFGGAAEGLTKNLVLLFGAVYTLLGVLGWFMDRILLYDTSPLVNLIHLVVGLWALYAALMAGKAAAPAAAA